MGGFPIDLDPKLLRSFVAVAEELHFTRAAARLYLAQQAVSRHVSRLEDELGVELFDRTTRQVELTAAGRRLLPTAQRLLALHDQMVEEARGGSRPLLVDTMAEGLSPTILVEEARRAAPQIEFLMRFSGGMAVGIANLESRQVDVTFGRTEGGRQPFDDRSLVRRLVRLEPLGLLLLEGDPLATLPAIPADLLRGVEIDTSAGNPAGPEWVDLAERFLDLVGAEPSPPHEPAVGRHETARHLRAHGRPILTMTEIPEVEGAVLRPIVDPAPLYPWAMTYHRDLDHPGLEHLRRAAESVIETLRWLERPEASWLPKADTRAFEL
jgi:DNA-binding transcriptional LysR family regulator